MSRGGREVADLVEEAWRRGARFDAWTELFDGQAWRGAAEALGIDLEAIAQTTYEPGYVLPWAHISAGVSQGFLARERERAAAEATTPDCTFGPCSNCGVCTDLAVRNQLAAERGVAPGEAEPRGEGSWDSDGDGWDDDGWGDEPWDDDEAAWADGDGEADVAADGAEGGSHG